MIHCRECLDSGHYDHCKPCTWRKNPVDEGRKDDLGKLRYDLIPVDAHREVVKVFNFGAQKYQDRNWERGIKYGRVYSAAQRHLNAWLEGEQDDQESGLSHLAHAAWNCLALLAYELRGMVEFDDRPNGANNKED